MSHLLQDLISKLSNIDEQIVAFQRQCGGPMRHMSISYGAYLGLDVHPTTTSLLPIPEWKEALRIEEG